MFNLEKLKIITLFGILLSLLMIAQKPVPSFSYGAPNIQFPQIPDSSNASVVQLDKNRIAVVDTRNGSTTYGKIIVMEFDEKTKRFIQVSNHMFSFDLDFK